MKTIFISWRMAECKAEVKALKAALEEEGVRVVVVGELPGEDLLEAVAQGMAEADLFIIMGTETYGQRTNDLFDTRKEMQQIISSKKPYFVFNMNPEHSLMRFKEVSWSCRLHTAFWPTPYRVHTLHVPRMQPTSS